MIHHAAMHAAVGLLAVLCVSLGMMPATPVEASLSITLAANSTAWIVQNDVPVDPFAPAYAIGTAPYVVDEATHELAVIFMPTVPSLGGTGSISYTLQFASSAPAVVSAVSVSGDLGTSTTGTVVDDTPMAVNFTYSCGDAGTSTITTMMLVEEFDFNGDRTGLPLLYSWIHEKHCPLNRDCPNNCSSHGSCHSTLINSHCVCDPGYAFEPDCSLGFWIDKSHVCLGEPFTVHWDAPGGASYTPTKGDWISVGIPQPAGTWSDPWDKAQYDAIIYDDTLVSELIFGWRYTNGDVATTTDTFHTGSFVMDIVDEFQPGVYPFAFSINNNYVAKGVAQVEVYSKFDYDHCPPRHPVTNPNGWIPYAASDEDCGGGVNDTHTPRGSYLNGTCVCNAPFFGERCAQGCQGMTVLTAHGQDFASSVETTIGKPNLYLNYQSCMFELRPPAIASGGMNNSAGILIQFKTFETENAYDFVIVYRGTDTNDVSSVVGSYAGIFAGFTLIVPAQVVTLWYYTSEWNPSASHTAPMTRWTGFSATYRALGCPAGSYHHYATEPAPIPSVVPIGKWTCRQCEAGKISSVADLTNCTQCQPGSYSTAGSTTCSTCGISQYQDQAGASTCLDCAENGYPSDYCVAPSQLTESERIALVAFSSLVSAGILGVFALVFKMRKARVRRRWTNALRSTFPASAHLANSLCAFVLSRAVGGSIHSKSAAHDSDRSINVCNEYCRDRSKADRHDLSSSDLDVELCIPAGAQFTRPKIISSAPYLQSTFTANDYHL